MFSGVETFLGVTYLPFHMNIFPEENLKAGNNFLIIFVISLINIFIIVIYAYFWIEIETVYYEFDRISTYDQGSSP